MVHYRHLVRLRIDELRFCRTITTCQHSVGVESLIKSALRQRSVQTAPWAVLIAGSTVAHQTSRLHTLKAWYPIMGHCSSNQDGEH